jgi:hypothetical protein
MILDQKVIFIYNQVEYYIIINTYFRRMHVICMFKSFCVFVRHSDLLVEEGEQISHDNEH